jgi:hypothetical protein
MEGGAMVERFRSEQDESLELAAEAPVEDPPSWAEQDPDRAEPADTTTADQLTTPGGGGEPGDEEPTEIAEAAGRDHLAGPEHAATRIDDEPG